MRAALSVHHAGRIQAAITSDSAAKSALVASWRRSSNLHHLDPADCGSPDYLTEAELKQARQRLEPLLQAAQSSLDRLFLAVGGVGCCVLLADRNGVTIERRGAQADDQTFRSWGLWTGAVWNEECQGTNGIGTCLVEQRALTIHRDQHFYTRNTGLSCVTAPVYDQEGDLAAVLDVSSCRADLTEAFANLISMAVGDAAQRIEAENFKAALPEARILLAPLRDKGSGALIAVNADDLVVGATRSARQGLGITQQYFQNPRPVADLLDLAQTDPDLLAGAERSVLQRALARANGNVSAAAQALGISRATLHRKLNRLDVHRSH
ncbi:helix-turn-helix domain-containing protein [Mesorhizobium sp. B2-4-6]|uniref:helix-turn-helix domain-containing protein n=1 Tax=Mesorhizobium sp. B2-4-6 TaxID=2589943 RepID=UPI001125F2ED|nr:helix-turn-helix domain-containing protein [Mesorhizobium sp. B2-4-6]TPL37252.1 sigma-54-dependent Fis family transcriptional regulator [Mesorhizobium sp. B2-4-6]